MEEKEGLLQKLVLAGLGLVYSNKDVVEKVVDDAVKKGEIKKDEGTKILKELKAKIKERKEDIQTAIEDEINKTLSKLGVISKKDLQDLEKRIDALEKSKSKKK